MMAAIPAENCSRHRTENCAEVSVMNLGCQACIMPILTCAYSDVGAYMDLGSANCHYRKSICPPIKC